MATLRQTFSDIADAIRAKGVSGSFKPIDMASKISEIQTGGSEPTNPRAVFAYDKNSSIVVPKMIVVDLSQSADLGYCFYNCKNLSSLTLPDGFGRVATNIDNCFSGCKGLTSLTLPAGFGRVATNINNCFSGCEGLVSLTLPDGFGSVAKEISTCFNNCTSLTSMTLPAGFGSAATDIRNCFWQCHKLKSLTLPVGFGQNATNISYCFEADYKLSSLTLPDGFGSVATDIRRSFYTCVNLVDLHLPEGFGQNVIKSQFAQNAFTQCTKLTNITGNPNFKVSFSLSDSTQLTHDRLMVVINGLQTVTSTQTLTLGSTNLAKLTEADKKIATDKGWTLA